MAKTQTTAAATAGFRVVLRGTTAAGARIRRVRTVQAASMDAACDAAGPVAQEMAAGLDNIFFNVYPPVGELCNGGLSRGYELRDGLIVKVAA